jgi:hypothetical protein
MIRRCVLFAMVFALTVCVAVPSAFAWGNGNNNGDGYGTHDWILDQAIRLAGSDGTWIDVPTALLATADPDQHRIPLTHTFYEKGLTGGAPFMVSELYYEAVKDYRAGDIEAASTAIGQMSHYYSDVLVPFHSAYAARNSPLHGVYESAVSRVTYRGSPAQNWIVPRGPQAFTDLRAWTVSAAAFSRSKYAALLKGFTSSGQIDAYGSVAGPITGALMNRAVNDLADIVRAVPSGTGTWTAPVGLKVDMRRHDPKLGGTACATAVCTGADGKPLAYVRVQFTWPTKSGTMVDTRYTDAHGVAANWHTLARTRAHRKVRVTAVVAAYGAKVTAATSYTPR